MRTTIDIEDDALLYAKRIAKRHNISLGNAVSQLIRRTYNLSSTEHTGLTEKYSLISRRGSEVITSEYVYRLLDQADIETYT